MTEIFQSAAIGSVPITALVMGLVEWCKRMGVAGKALNVASLVIGGVIGGLYLYSQANPTTAEGWFGVIAYGLTLGLTASGIYDVINKQAR